MKILKNQKIMHSFMKIKKTKDESFNKSKKQGINNPEKETDRLINLLKNNNPIEVYDIYP